MIAALNYKPWNKGSIIGFMDIQIGVVTIKGARLMAGKDNGQMWVALPRMPSTDDNGNKNYHEIIHVTAPVIEHIRQAVLCDLEAQGHLEKPKREKSFTRRPKATHKTPEGEDLSEHYTDGSDDIPF